jgi:hypothetical protein
VEGVVLTICIHRSKQVKLLHFKSQMLRSIQTNIKSLGIGCNAKLSHYYKELRNIHALWKLNPLTNTIVKSLATLLVVGGFGFILLDLLQLLPVAECAAPTSTVELAKELVDQVESDKDTMRI